MAMASLARREKPIYEDVRSHIGLGMFLRPPMNPPDDERTKENKRHKQRQAVFRNHPIEKAKESYYQIVVYHKEPLLLPKHAAEAPSPQRESLLRWKSRLSALRCRCSASSPPFWPLPAHAKERTKTAANPPRPFPAMFALRTELRVDLTYFYPFVLSPCFVAQRQVRTMKT
jgi:hypothetical protein